MKKRLLALFLVLALLVTCLPIGAVAEGTEDDIVIDNVEQTEVVTDEVAQQAEQSVRKPATKDTTPKKGDHEDDAHKCEHCDQFVTWTKWGNANGKTGTMPSTSGHYVLDTDINPAGRVALTTQDIVICLNGYTITSSATDGDKTDSLYSIGKNATAKVTITDCTAHYAEDGTYTAGVLTGGSNSCIMFQDGAKAEATFTLYDGIFTGNRRNSAEGGAISILGGGTCNIYGGQFRDNNAKTLGGAIYIKGGTLNIQGKSAERPVVFELNEAKGSGGGAVYVHSTTATLQYVDMTGNKANGGGSALHITNGGTTTVRDSYFTENEITGSGSTYKGAVYVAGTTSRFIFGGKVVIENNEIADLYVQNNNSRTDNQQWINLDGLSEGSKLPMTTQTAVDEAVFNSMVLEGAPTQWDKLWITYQNQAVDYNKEEDKFFFTSTSTHIHCACGAHLYADATCDHGAVPGCDHSEITYEPWGDDESEKGKLPNVPGNFYLVDDVVVSKETAVSTNSGIPDVINLCLNGKEIRVDYATEGKINDQIFYITLTADLTISDCTAHTDAEGNYVAGKLTGGTYSAISLADTSNKNPDAKLTLFDGILTGNNRNGNGGAIYMFAGTSTFNMYGGEISGNTASGNGGAVYVGEGNTFNMYGGVIFGNAANKVTNSEGKTSGGSGGGVYVDKGTFNMYGGEISGNTAQTNAGAVMLSGAATVMTMQGGKISGNSGAAGSGIYVYSNAELTISGGEISGNAGTGNGGGVYVHTNAAGVSISGDTVITDNTNKNVINNLYLASEALITVGTMGENANVGITGAVSKLPRQVSANEAALDGLVNDDVHRPLELIDGKVYISFTKDHYHCDCGGGDTGCEHKQNYWVAWYDTTSLPTGDGYYYLATDVTLTGRTNHTTGDLHLCLNGHTVTVNAEENSSQDRIWQLNGDAKLTISDCTAVYAKDGTYTAGKLTGGSNGVIFVPNNTGKNDDGSEIVNTVVLNIYDGIITGNYINGIGGALLLQDGATGNMYGGEVSGNTAKIVTDADGKTSGGNAAALYVGTNAVFNLHDGAIRNNTAEGVGAVYVDYAAITMTGGQIADNKSAEAGAGIFVAGKTSVFTMEGGTISGNKSEKAAGGVLLQNYATMKLTGGEIAKNSATHGAGVYVSYTASFTMEGGAISGNQAKTSGGGLYLLGSTAKLTGGKISGNYAKTSGGGIYTTSFVREATQTRPEETLTAQLELASVTVSGNTTDGNGAGIIANKSTVVTMTGGSITGNTAAKAAGGILLQSKSRLNLKSGSVSYNSAKNGGGVYVSTGTTIHMTGGTVSYNTASGSCGGMYLLRCNATLAGGSINNNTTKSNGGGIYAAGGEITLCGTSICDNVAEGNGGGIGTTQAKAGDARYYTTITMTGGRISGNTALNGGGVLTQNRTTFTLKDGVIENNKTTKSGAGMYISSNCTFFMEGGTVQNNEAQVNGGGIYQYKSNGTYTGGVIQNNKAIGNAGGLTATGEGNTVTIKSLTVTGNAAKAAGGVLFQGKVVGNIEGGEFTNNTAESHGGAVYVSGKTTMHVTGGNFSDNTAGNRGGAMYMAVTSNSTVTNATFTGNKAADGGAIYVQSNLEISDCVITGNEAENNGGGISTGKLGSRMFMQPKGLVAKNLTVEGNNAGGQGGGLYLSVGCQTVLRNSTVTGNAAGAEGGGIWAIFDSDFSDLTVTGNTSGGEGYGFYLAASEYDGESYVKGVIKFAGVMTVKDNNGGDMYIGEQTTATIAKEGLSEGTLMNIKLHSGLLTQTLYGAYNYEGGNGEYMVTAGDKSLTAPEYDPDWNAQFNPTEPEMEPTEAPTGTDTELPTGVNPLIWIIAGGAAVAVVAIAVIIAAISKKKKTAAGK